MASKVVTNKDYVIVACTDDGMIELGKVNGDGVISAFKVTSGLSAGKIPPHYFQMDRDPKKPGEEGKKIRVGGTQFRGGGTFVVKHGDNTRGSTTASKPNEGEPGVYIDSTNGDLVLKSNRRIRIIAENIDLIAGSHHLTDPNKDGNITLTANQNIIAKANKINMEAGVSSKFFSDGTVEIIGKGILNMFGDLIQCADGHSTVSKGSVGSEEEPYRTMSPFEERMKEMYE